VLLLGPRLEAVSGVSAHLQTLLCSRLAEEFVLEHFQVGSEGHAESRAGRWLRLLLSPRALAAAIRARRPVLVHLNTSLNLRAFWRDVVYLIVARLHGTRVLYQVHGGALPQDFFGSSRLLSALLRWILALPEAIVVLAESELAAYRRFVPNQLITLVPNAIDCAPYLALPRKPSAIGPLALIYLGRLAREKGLYELLQGLAAARARGAMAHLTVVGSGPEEAQLRRAVAELGLTGAVFFAGPLFGAAKLQLLASADVLVLPSYSEGLPYALLEGMAAGTAVIATHVGAVPDVVVAGLHGVLVPPRDMAAIASAISTLAADRTGLARMSTACRSRIAACYSVERLARSFRDVYSGLLATRAARKRAAA
jgi:glycosyltransferase involved in cell wall biosynthesis